MELRFFSLGLAAATVLGCGSKSGHATSSNGADAESFCHSLVSLMSARAATCYHDSQRNWTEAYETVLNCDELKAAVDAGRISYDPAAGALCLSKEQTAACSDRLLSAGLTKECEAALVGHVGTDGPCRDWGFAHYQCSPSHFCYRGYSSCSRTCQPNPRLADLPDANAPPNSRFLSEGQPCDSSSQTYCENGLYCAGDDGFFADVGACRKQKTSGSCMQGSECAWEYGCRRGVNGDNASCIPFKTVGESCTPGEAECIEGYACAHDGKCVPWASLKQGDACSDINENLFCGYGLYCDLESATCRPGKPNGAPCDLQHGDPGCLGDGSYCDEMSKTCVDCT